MAVITRQTQKDIGNYEAKLIGPFTTRQAALIGIGIIPTAIAIMIARAIGVTDIFAMLVIAFTFMAIPGFFAFGKKFCHDMKPENFLVDYYFYHYKSPKERLYKTKTFDDELWNKEHKTVETKSKKSEPTKKPKQIKGYRYFE